MSSTLDGLARIVNAVDLGEETKQVMDYLRENGLADDYGTISLELSGNEQLLIAVGLSILAAVDNEQEDACRELMKYVKGKYERAVKERKEEYGEALRKAAISGLAEQAGISHEEAEEKLKNLKAQFEEHVEAD